MTKIFFADTKNLHSEAVCKKYYDCLSEQRKAKADRYFLEKDKILSVAVGVLIDMGLKEYGLSEKEMTIKTNEYGKTYFENRSDIFFNASHSDDKVMVCFSDHEVGCDIEKIKEYDENLPKRFFHKNEACENADEFFRLWTLKESYIKAVGKGLLLPLSSFEIIFEDGRPKVKEDDGYLLFEISAFDGFMSAYCVKSPLDEVQIKYPVL